MGIEFIRPTPLMEFKDKQKRTPRVEQKGNKDNRPKIRGSIFKRIIPVPSSMGGIGKKGRL